MNAQALKLLAKHLPSYEKGDEVFCLRKDGKYSVLGVMADIFRRANKGKAVWEEDPGRPDKFVVTKPEHVESLAEPWRLDTPPEVLDWYGITREQSNQLWLFQARGYNFLQIAKAIEKGVKKV